MTGPAAMAPAPMTHAAVIRAFAYLQATSIFNSLRQRLRRLRQPKYLFGAIAGAAYMYFFFFRKLLLTGAASRNGSLAGMPSELTPLIAAMAALALFAVVALAWLVPSDRAALKFSEAEVAFLFPAPLSRATLIQFALLRSQIAIFFSAFLMSLLVRRGGSLGGNAWQHAAGIWLAMSTINLHFLGASFTRERLLEFGIRPALRRIAVGGVLIAIAVGCWWWLRAQLPVPTADDLAEPGGLFRYVGTVLAAPPVSWLLAPFKMVVAPFFAADASGFLRALVPALLLLVAHYVWVVRSDVSFEEASIDLARKRAERINAMRDGKRNLRDRPAKARNAPFRLAPQGFAPIAFLWKGLIAMGPFWRLRTWLIACALVIAGSYWLAADPARKPLLQIFGGIAAMVGGWFFLLGPMMMQRGMRQTLEHLDILKASPLRGWQIALGELLSPLVVMAFGQWLLLLIVVMSFTATTGSELWTTANVAAGAIGIALLAPPLCGLMLCVPFAGLLVFPAWTAASGTGNRGVEVMGQRMIFMGGYLLTLALALTPAVLLGGLAFLLVQMMAGMPVALLATALVAGAVLVLELAGSIEWLGRRIDRFDLSLEMSR